MEARLYKLMVETALPYRELRHLAHLSTTKSVQEIAKRILHKRGAHSRMELLVNHWRKKIDG
jgi:hypothetical protein